LTVRRAKARPLFPYPKPSFQTVPVAELVERIQNLFPAQVDEANIEFRIHMEQETLELTADP